MKRFLLDNLIVVTLILMLNRVSCLRKPEGASNLLDLNTFDPDQFKGKNAYKNFIKFKKEREKLKKDISSLKRKMKAMYDDSKKLVTDNKNLKENLTSKETENKKLGKKIKLLKNSSAGSGTKNIKEIRGILHHLSEFQGVENQLKAFADEEKVLETLVNSRLETVIQKHKQINEIYSELKISFRDKLQQIIKNVTKLEKADKDFKDQIFLLEKEKEKTANNRRQTAHPKTSGGLLEPPCVNRNSCNICLDDPKCVWCAKQGQCAEGDLAGPFDGSCKNYWFTSCMKESFCSQIKTCSECIEHVGCGWCGEMGRCLEGNDKRPVGIPCSESYFHRLKQGRCSSHTNFITN